MDLIVKKASALSAEEKTELNITGIPEDWPIEVYPYVEVVPDGYTRMTTAEFDALKFNNQAAYDAWAAALRPIIVHNPTQTVVVDTPKDNDDAQIVRIKTNTVGWYYQDRCLSIITSTLNSLNNICPCGTPKTDAIIKFYNAADEELLTQEAIDAGCVKTIVDLEPLYDFELISATIYTVEKTAQSVYLGCVIAPRILNSLGNKCVLAGGDFNQKNEFIIKGGTVKKLYWASYHSNEIRSIILHPVGFKVKINFCVGHYLA